VRACWLPLPSDPRDAMLNGARLGGVMANSLGMPLFILMGVYKEYPGIIVLGVAGWVLCTTLWRKAFGFAWRIRYYPVSEESER
jgi:hypothetical protein